MNVGTLSLARRLDRAFCILGVALLFGCAPGSNLLSEPPNITGASNPLPALPRDHPAIRSVSAVQDFIVDGRAEFATSPTGASENGTTMELTAAGGLAFSIYRVDFGNNDGTLEIDLTISGDEAWVALSDYANNTWQFSAPLSDDPGEITVGSDNTSAGGNVYFAVLAFGNSQVTVHETLVGIEIPNPQGIHLRGRLLDDGSNPLVGAEVFIPFHNRKELSDSNGNYLFENVPADVDLRIVPSLSGFSFAPAKIFVDTTTSQVGQDFVGKAETMPATVTYTLHMRPQVFEPVCMNCHHSANSGIKRHGAPVTVNWDTYDGTTLSKKGVGNTRAQTGSMPPLAFGNMDLNTFQKQLFQAWNDGGFLE